MHPGARVSKRDDDAGDMEVGMTTAERRRRRRRGTGLRVPSDNVPRSRTPTAPPPPVPEDPALAMSIAYSFTNDASGPVQRPSGDGLPMAPEAMPTVIDPPSAGVEQADFEMNTREMSAVDLEALGLSSEAPATVPFTRSSAPRIDRNEVDVDVSVDEPVTRSRSAFEDAYRRQTGELQAQPGPAPAAAAAPAPVKPAAAAAKAPVPGGRHKTMALSEEDLEEVRAATQPGRAKPATQPPPLSPAAAKKALDSNSTMPLQAMDVEVVSKPSSGEEPVSVADIDIQELADRAEQSGEIEVDVDADEPPAAVARAASRPSVPPVTAPATPPTPAKTDKPAAPAPAAAPAASGQPQPQKPPPPAQAAKPPAPPPAQPKKPPPVAAPAKEPGAATPGKQRQWFVDLFDEDYLRTLPFLTPQATQAEAEFVLNAMSLAPGAQVLDLGCGYGRHAMELAARGFHVVGLDLSTPLLVRGGEEAHRRNLTINFVRGDMRELDFEHQFDACYCLFSTFGYFDDETNKKTLQNVGRALKPGGKVLVEILNRDYIIQDLPTRVWWEGDGCVVLEEVELNYFSSRIQVNRSVVFDDGRQLEQEISVRAYSLHEVGKLMHAAGFRVLEVSGGYQMKGRFLGNQSRHIIVLAEKKETSGS